MSLTFAEICDASTKPLGMVHRAAFRYPGAPTPAQVVKQTLMEIGPDDVRYGRPVCKHRLKARVLARCKRKYGCGVLLTIVLTAALYALVECVVEWIWSKFVKSAGLSAVAEGNSLAEIVPVLNEIGRAA